MAGFVAYIFEGKRTAAKAIDKLEDKTDAAWIDDIAVISKSRWGSLNVQSSFAQDDGMAGVGAGWGIIAGGLLGMLFGPAGAAAGATVGAGAGAMAGLAESDYWKNPDLEKFANSLKDNTSAIVLIGEENTLSDLKGAIGPFDGRVIETGLDKKEIKLLAKTIKSVEKLAKRVER